MIQESEIKNMLRSSWKVPIPPISLSLATVPISPCLVGKVTPPKTNISPGKMLVGRLFFF